MRRSHQTRLIWAHLLAGALANTTLIISQQDSDAGAKSVKLVLRGEHRDPWFWVLRHHVCNFKSSRLLNSTASGLVGAGRAARTKHVLQTSSVRPLV